MRAEKRIVAPVLLLLILVGGLSGSGCGPSEEERQEQARAAEWQELERMKAELDARRQELRALQAELRQAGAGQAADGVAAPGGDEGGEVAPDPAQLESQVAALEAEVNERTDGFNQRLVEFINDNPVVEGQEPTERQLAAIRMKSEEDLVLAAEYIEKGGDYRRAIEIYQTALAVDPGNERLEQALEDAEQQRYMTEERFADVQKGMTQDQVRQILGQVNYHNIRDYPERDVVAWFYPREDGGAAGVFFEKSRKTGDFVVYQFDFDSVPPRGEREAG